MVGMVNYVGIYFNYDLRYNNFMTDELVTIIEYSDSIEANVAKSKLTSENIFCFLANEELMNSPTLRTVIGSVKLQVKSKDVKRAKQILGIE